MIDLTRHSGFSRTFHSPATPAVPPYLSEKPSATLNVTESPPLSRYNRYLRALATGYGLLAVNIAYTLILVPLALSHLGAELFGLWALTMQIGAIAQLADAGMTGALNRIIVDYKDDKNSAGYRQVFYTMWLVFSLIGAGLVVLIWGIAPTLIRLLAIPPEFHGLYVDFLTAYGLLLGFTFMVKPLTVLPFSHQRSDLLNLLAIGGLVASLFTIWQGLNREWGLWSLFAGMVVSHGFSMPAVLIICFRLRLFPRASHHPKLSLRAFREVFDYGKDRLLITMGYTALQAAPTFLITRILGLEAIAVWNVASRATQLCQQMINKLYDLGYPVVAEMFVRGENEVLRRRYNDLLLVGFGLASVAAVGVASCNRDFVNLWTGGRILATPLLDVMLALWLVMHIIQKLFFMPASVARDLKDIRFYFLLEAILVVGLGILFLRSSGEIWVMAVVLSVASLLITIPRNFFKARGVLQCGAKQLIRPVSLIGTRAAIPAVALIAAAMILPPAQQWPELAFKSLLVASSMAIFLSSLSELRQIAVEAIRRVFHRRQRRNAT